MRKLLVVFLLAMISTISVAEVRKVKLFCDVDSFSVGQPISITLSVLHDEEKKLYFPDSTNDYLLYEFISKKVFPTKFRVDSLLLDSVIYKLRSFEIKDSIPVFLDVLEGQGDQSNTIRSNVKWLYNLNSIISGKEKELLHDVEYKKVPKLIDYPLYIMILIIIGIIVLIILIVFLPKFIKARKIARFKKQHQNFITIAKENEVLTEENWTSFLNSWKKDLGRSWSKNLNGYTLNKLQKELTDPSIKRDLKTLEQYVYASKKGRSEELKTIDLSAFISYAEQEHHVKLKQLKE